MLAGLAWMSGEHNHSVWKMGCKIVKLYLTMRPAFLYGQGFRALINIHKAEGLYSLVGRI